MKWPEEVNYLRTIILENESVEETVKWGIPVFTYKGKNIVGVAKFKSYFGLWFYDGALLNDKDQVLINAQKGKTKALRQIRYNTIEEVDRSIILDLLDQALKIVDSGKSFKPEKSTTDIPKELKEAMENDDALNRSFNNLTPYKRKEYCSYIGDAKRQATRQKRLENSIDLILNEKGLNDQYR